MSSLLTHRNVVVRVLSAWLSGLAIFVAAWLVSYLWLPERSFRFLGSVALTSSGQPATLPEALSILAWNLALVAGPVVLSSLFAVGRLPCSYLMPWVVCAAYGGLLGTNSFALPDPAGPMAPNLAVAWTRAGVREITAYLVLAAALADMYVWRQRSWWSVRVERIRSWRALRLSPAELLFLAAGVALLAWAAYVEASQIVLQG